MAYVFRTHYQSLVFCVVYYRSWFVRLSFYLLVTVLSVPLPFTAPDFLFGIFNLRGKDRYHAYVISDNCCRPYSYHHVETQWGLVRYEPYDKTFLHSSLINGLVTRVARRVLHVEWKLLTLSGHMCSLQFDGWTCGALSLVLCLIFWTLHCLSYYFFCIGKLFLHAYSFSLMWNYPTFVVSGTLIYICSILNSFSNK
jgi:hypothetical protein